MLHQDVWKSESEPKKWGECGKRIKNTVPNVFSPEGLKGQFEGGAVDELWESEMKEVECMIKTGEEAGGEETEVR